MAQMTFGLAAVTPSPSRTSVRRSSKRGHFRAALRPRRQTCQRVARPSSQPRTFRRSGEHAVLGLASTKPLTLTAGLTGLPETAGLRGPITAAEPARTVVRPGLTGLSGA